MGRLRNILVVSAGVFHPSLRARRQLRKVLERVPESRFHFSSALGAATLTRPQYDAAVLYVHAQRSPPGALEKLDRFITEGGGLLALHSATASFKQVPAFARLIGGRFAGHSRVRDFILQAAPAAEDEFRSLPAIRLRDEIYRHQCEEDIHVQFTTVCENQMFPMAWTRRHGAGRIFYFAPGHRAATLRNPAVADLLARALAWVAPLPSTR